MVFGKYQGQMNKRGEYTMEKFKICSKCGAKIEADARFCTKCGLKITGEDFNQTNTIQEDYI